MKEVLILNKLIDGKKLVEIIRDAGSKFDDYLISCIAVMN